MSATARYLCTGCGVAYGEGKTTSLKKLERGFCAGCWEVHLALERQSIRRSFVERSAERGELPVWSFAATRLCTSFPSASPILVQPVRIVVQRGLSA